MEETVKQAIKYGIVGVSNTVITAVVIWIMMKLFGCSDVVSNMVGYVAGVLNYVEDVGIKLVEKYGISNGHSEVRLDGSAVPSVSVSCSECVICCNWGF